MQKAIHNSKFQFSRADNSNIEACTALHERWQQNQKAWFAQNLADSEHKIMLAEEGFKKVSKSTNAKAAIDGTVSYSQRHLR